MTESAALAAWLARIEQLHAQNIALGLERVGAVYQRLGIRRLAPCVISVAGTNGKGSVAAILESILEQAGYRTGCYTSPHLWHYCERLRVQGHQVDDHDMVAAFAAVERARGAIELTYFEFGTLAAMHLMANARLDVAILEVGMGGRLDAVNVVDADVAIITQIGLDHQHWLGDHREDIGREKAGIMRAGRPAVCADQNPPRSVLQVAENMGALLHLSGRDYHYVNNDDRWSYRSTRCERVNLPLPALAGQHQLANAAAALTALGLLQERLPTNARNWAAGLRAVTLTGRMQTVATAPRVILDVAHNADGARVLAEELARQPVLGRTHLVLSVLADKDSAAIVAALAPQVDAWYLAGSSGPRGMAASQIFDELQVMDADVPVDTLQSVAEALTAAQAAAAAHDRIIVCGSFLTVAAAATALGLGPSLPRQ